MGNHQQYKETSINYQPYPIESPFSASSLPATMQNRAEHPQNRESHEGANIQSIKNRRNYIPKQIQIRIAQIPNRRQRLPIPWNVGKPAQQNPNHQNPTVQVQPLRHTCRHHRERRVQRSHGVILRRREERGARSIEQRLLQLYGQVKERVGEEL